MPNFNISPGHPRSPKESSMIPDSNRDRVGKCCLHIQESMENLWDFNFGFWVMQGSLPWVHKVLTLHHLPGWVFVVTSYNEIHVIQILARIHSEPYLLPTSDWNHPSLFQPWSICSITVGSWMRILIPGIYKGDLTYVVGVSKLSDCIMAAIL